MNMIYQKNSYCKTSLEKILYYFMSWKWAELQDGQSRLGHADQLSSLAIAPRRTERIC